VSSCRLTLKNVGLCRIMSMGVSNSVVASLLEKSTGVAERQHQAHNRVRLGSHRVRVVRVGSGFGPFFNTLSTASMWSRKGLRESLKKSGGEWCSGGGGPY